MSGGSAGAGQVCLRIRDASVLVVARRHVRELGAQIRLSEGEVEALATAVTEIARNIVVHAGSGELVLNLVSNARRRGVQVIAHDEGPGITDLTRAMQDGYSTAGGGLGLGLPSAARLVDDFEVESSPGRGTKVTMRKWASLEAAVPRESR